MTRIKHDWRNHSINNFPRAGGRADCRADLLSRYRSADRATRARLRSNRNPMSATSCSRSQRRTARRCNATGNVRALRTNLAASSLPERRVLRRRFPRRATDSGARRGRIPFRSCGMMRCRRRLRVGWSDRLLASSRKRSRARPCSDRSPRAKRRAAGARRSAPTRSTRCVVTGRIDRCPSLPLPRKQIEQKRLRQIVRVMAEKNRRSNAVRRATSAKNS